MSVRYFRLGRPLMLACSGIILAVLLACMCRLPAPTRTPPTPYPTYTPLATYTPPPTDTPPSPSATPTVPTPTPTATLKPQPTKTSTPSITPHMLIVGTHFFPILPLNDLVLEDVFLSTSNEVVLRVGNNPPGGLSGPFAYQVFADGSMVAQSSATIPNGSQAFYSGYKVVGQQTIHAVIDPGNQILELNEGNNQLTKTCSSASHSCW